MVFTRDEKETKDDVWSISLEGDAEPVLFLQTDADEDRPVLSPDGRFVAFASDESGESQIYIKPFPEGPGKWQASVEMGWWAYWSPVGDQIYFLNRRTLMEVELSTDPLRLGTPRVLIDGEKSDLTLWRGFAMTKDGTRFVGTRNHREAEDEEEAEDGFHVVENWFSDFED